MIRRIRDSLNIKVFLITCLLLLIICFATFGFDIFFMPNTYTSEVNPNFSHNADVLVEKLKSQNFNDSGPLFGVFAAQNNVSVVIKDAKGHVVKIPGYDNTDVANVQNDPTADWGSDFYFTTDGPLQDIFNKNVTFYTMSFANSDEKYLLIFIGKVKLVSEAREALANTLPIMSIVILFMSLIVAAIYSRFVTKPIIEISRVSEHMSNLDFKWDSDVSRTDEIGKLTQNLYSLSEKLNTTLDELKSANIALQQDIEQERLNENRRRAFFSAVSHELKTPITVVKGQLEGMIGNVGVYQDHEKYLRRALDVTIRMDTLVQELLMMSRLESPEYALNLTQFDLWTLVLQCLDDHEDFISRKNMLVETKAGEDLMVEADQMLIKRVLNNLLINALKYSPDGSTIILQAFRAGLGVRFTIENTNAHIPEDTLPELFNAFYRVEKSRNRGTGGSGLGIHIVKTILELHKADYKIENTENGVCFTFYLK